jgi:hypothetical protein
MISNQYQSKSNVENYRKLPQIDGSTALKMKLEANLGCILKLKLIRTCPDAIIY